MQRRWLVAILISLGTVLLSLLPFSAQARRSGGSAWAPPGAPSPVASVFWIKGGVTVQPPHKKAAGGKKNQKLFKQYFVRTKKQQRTGLAFTDGTRLYVNQRTDLVLKSPNLTQVNQGTVAQEVAPGTDHKVQTASAIASAIGTKFEVIAKKKKVADTSSKKGKKKKKTIVESVFVVSEGVVEVKNQFGDVVVRAGQQVTVEQGKPPSAPVQTDARGALAWTSEAPPPRVPVGLNVALQDNGGRIVEASSETVSAAPTAVAHLSARQSAPDWRAARVIDGLPNTGWSTGTGKVSNQWVKIAFQNGNEFMLNAVIINPGATGGHPSSNDLKEFQIRVSTTGTADSHFETVFSGTTRQESSMQVFALPSPVLARYVELVAVNNYGSTSAIDVAEFEAVSRSNPIVPPTDTPTPTATSTPIPTATPIPSPTPKPVYRTYTFDVGVGVNDFDAGDTPNVPVTEELYKYFIHGSVCATDPFGVPWKMEQVEQTTDDGRNLDLHQPYTLTFPRDSTIEVPGAFYQTKLTLHGGDAPVMTVDISAPQHDPPEITGDSPIKVTDGCSPTAARAAARATPLLSAPVTQYQTAMQKLNRINESLLRPAWKLEARRAELRTQERALIAAIRQGHPRGKQLRRVQDRISDLDEGIHEYREWSTELGPARARTQQQLRTMLRKSMYGTWMKARE